MTSHSRVRSSSPEKGADRTRSGSAIPIYVGRAAAGFQRHAGAQLGEARGAEAAQDDERPSAARGQAARELHAAVAVDVGQHHHELGALDEGVELRGAARVGVAGVELDAVAGVARDAREERLGAVQASDDPDVHGSKYCPL